jgi:hypothetical protein
MKIKTENTENHVRLYETQPKGPKCMKLKTNYRRREGMELKP